MVAAAAGADAAERAWTAWRRPQLQDGIAPAEPVPQSGCPSLCAPDPRRPAAAYTGMAPGGRMARQPIRSLPPEVWDEFVETLKRGPTPEQALAVKRAKELARNIVLLDSSAVRDKRICRPPA